MYFCVPVIMSHQICMFSVCLFYIYTDNANIHDSKALSTAISGSLECLMFDLRTTGSRVLSHCCSVCGVIMLTMCWLSPTDTAEEVVSYFVDVCVGGSSDQCDSMPWLRIMCCSVVFIFIYKGMCEGKCLKERKYILNIYIFMRIQVSD